MTLEHRNAKDFSPLIKIHRSSNGAVLGAALWVPGHIIERCILPGQEEIGVTFEENRILLGKEEKPTAATAGQIEPQFLMQGEAYVGDSRTS